MNDNSAKDLTASTELDQAYRTGNQQEVDRLLQQYGIDRETADTPLSIDNDRDKQALRDAALSGNPNLTLEEAKSLANLIDARDDVNAINQNISALDAGEQRTQLQKVSKLLTNMLIAKDVYFDSSLELLVPNGVSRITGDALNQLNFSESDFRGKGAGYVGALYTDESVAATTKYIFAN